VDMKTSVRNRPNKILLFLFLIYRGNRVFPPLIAAKTIYLKFMKKGFIISTILVIIILSGLVSIKFSDAATLSSKLKGKILLQVENHGEAWYVNPSTGNRHYMADGNSAYKIMRDLGVGITDKNLEKIKSNKLFAKQNSGKIFLQVESHGEAYYIDSNGNAHYLKDGAAAYSVMRDLGVGITNKDIRAISISTTTITADIQAQPEKSTTTTETIEINVTTPTLEQLSRLRNFCLLDFTLNSAFCGTKSMQGYYTNENYRWLIDDAINKYYTALSSQKTQKIAAEKQISDCLMAPTPENERTQDPATQNYLRQLRCGTVTPTDKTNYELSRIKSSLDELKYRLDTKTTFTPVLLDPIPTLKSKTSWQLRWEGPGMGSVVYSNGDSYKFHCDDMGCKSY